MTTTEQNGQKLRDYAMSFPETHEDFPWGERAIKVKGKAFIFMRYDAKELSFSVKLPQSADLALDTGFAEPTHYGLGKHGWVTIKMDAKTKLPFDVLTKWIDESYRAVAPKTLVKALDAASAGSGAASTASPPRSAGKSASPRAGSRKGGKARGGRT